MVYFCMRVMLFFFKVSNFIALTKIFVKFFEVNDTALSFKNALNFQYP